MSVSSSLLLSDVVVAGGGILLLGGLRKGDGVGGSCRSLAILRSASSSVTMLSSTMGALVVNYL